MHRKILIPIAALLLLEAAALAGLFTSFELYTGGPDASAAERPRPSVPLAAALPEKIELIAGDKTLAVDPKLVITNGYIADAVLGRELLAVAVQTNRAPQNAALEIVDGEATAFAPDKPGQELDLLASWRRLRSTLVAGVSREITLKLPVRLQQPERTLAKLNSLGIDELLVSGQSDFTGSSASRIQNIRVGAARYNGVIIAPGEEFAFNKHLGPIDAAHGFLPELVIKPEGTVPEFGGGLCQVSTTAFRAAFFGGLPITQRRNHAYAVKYYEWIADGKPRAPGLDATIYPGASDLKFVNDTPGSVLVWTRLEGKRLYFDFYGTSDGRQITVDGPHPFDRKASGAVKSTVKRTVTKNGESAELVLNSNYVSPDRYPRVTEYPKPVEPTPPAPETPPANL